MNGPGNLHSCTADTCLCSITGMSNTLSMNGIRGMSNSKNCWNLSLHGHRNVNRPAQYLCTALGWRWLLHPGGRGGLPYVLTRVDRVPVSTTLSLCVLRTPTQTTSRASGGFQAVLPEQSVPVIGLAVVGVAEPHPLDRLWNVHNQLLPPPPPPLRTTGASCFWRRKESAPLSMTSPADPASTGKAKVGKPSTTEARAAASSLTCGAGSGGRPGCVPEEVPSCPRRATCVSCTSSSSSCLSRLSTTFSSTVQRCGGGLLRGPLRPTAARDATEHAVVADAALQRLPMRHQHQTWRQQLEFHVNVTQKNKCNLSETPGGGGGDVVYVCGCVCVGEGRGGEGWGEEGGG